MCKKGKPYLGITQKAGNSFGDSSSFQVIQRACAFPQWCLQSFVLPAHFFALLANLGRTLPLLQIWRSMKQLLHTQPQGSAVKLAVLQTSSHVNAGRKRNIFLAWPCMCGACRYFSFQSWWNPCGGGCFVKQLQACGLNGVGLRPQQSCACSDYHSAGCLQTHTSWLAQRPPQSVENMGAKLCCSALLAVSLSIPTEESFQGMETWKSTVFCNTTAI